MASVELYKEFRFDAAHFLPHAAEGHPNSRVHGHSFRVSVKLKGVPDPETGILQDLEGVTEALASVRDRLDHHMLNEVEGLEVPTLENLAIYIYNALKLDLPSLSRVGVHRDSLNEGCEYGG